MKSGGVNLVIPQDKLWVLVCDTFPSGNVVSKKWEPTLPELPTAAAADDDDDQEEQEAIKKNQVGIGFDCWSNSEMRSCPCEIAGSLLTYVPNSHPFFLFICCSA
jgi:hypothetical protein